VLEAHSVVLMVDELIDMANRLHYQAGQIPDEKLSARLHRLAREIEDIAKTLQRAPPPRTP